MIKAVTFDWWFTIVNMPVRPDEYAIWSRGYRVEGMQKILVESGHDVSTEQLANAYDLLTKHLKEVWDRYLDVSGEEQISILLQYAGVSRVKDPKLIEKLSVPFSGALFQRPPGLNDGIVDCLRDLKKDGYRIGVISNTGRTWGRVLRELQKIFGISEFFEILTFSDEMGLRKPHPVIFTKTLKEFNLPAESVLHIGDNVLDDVHGAKSVGMKAVWYNTGTWPDAKTSEADAEINHFSELPAIARRL